MRLKLTFFSCVCALAFGCGGAQKANVQNSNPQTPEGVSGSQPSQDVVFESTDTQENGTPR